MARRASDHAAESGGPGPAKLLSLRAEKGVRAALPPDWLPLALIGGDALIVAASVLLSFYYRRYVDVLNQADRGLSLTPYLAAVPATVAIFLFALAVSRQYRSWRGRTLAEIMIDLAGGVALAAILILAAISVTNLGFYYSRLTIAYVVVLTVVLMGAERYLLRQYETHLRRAGIGTEKVLMVGTGAGSEMLIRRMQMFPQYGYQVVGVLDDALTVGDDFAGSRVVGGIQELDRAARELSADQVFIALPGGDRERLLALVKRCEDERLEFKIVPDLLDVMSTRIEANSIDGLPLVGIRRSRLVGANAALKRAIDVVVSALGLLLLSPLLLLVTILIRITSPGGPAVFRQKRIGYQGREFEVFKFRTMVPNAEAETGPVVAQPGDPRATRLGRFLRRFSLDELPQLYNVLRGDMSLVGPRPQPTYFDQRYSGEVPRYLERQQVRPGLTGWAEVNDLRGAAPIVDRTLYDTYYIENWSLALDAKILLLTVLRVLFQSNAY